MEKPCAVHLKGYPLTRPSNSSGDIHDLDDDELGNLQDGDVTLNSYDRTRRISREREPSKPSGSTPVAPEVYVPVAPERTAALDSESLIPPAALPKSESRSSRKGSVQPQQRNASADQPKVQVNLRSKSEEDIDAMLGVVLGSYRILSLIGEGGMGRVYLAEHVKLGRKVALKLLRPEYAVKRDAVQRFFTEAQSVNTIGHENIVDITDFVELETGETFIIMELLQGEDLADIQRRSDRPMPLHRAMMIALQVCDALEAAHQSDIIHRDLKPDNIFIVNSGSKRDFVKLLDFGVAKLLGERGERESLQTAAGSVIGTPAYMSPEQASGIPVDHRSDIYSLGAILYELFTGYPVFRAKSFGEYVVKHMNDDPVAPRDLANAPPIPASLEAVILRCLEKNPDRRYPSVAVLREELSRVTATVETVLHEVTHAANAPPSRRRWLVLLPIFILVGGLAIAAFWLASGLSFDEVTRPRGEPTPPLSHSSFESPKPAQTEPLDPNQTPAAILLMTSDPPGAEVFSKKQPYRAIGTTPLKLSRTNLGEEEEFIFRLAGHEEKRQRVKIAHRATVSVLLKRMEPRESSSEALSATSSKTKKKRLKEKGQVGDPSTRKSSHEPEEEPRPRRIDPSDVVDPFK
jgi:serine/threonine protein kinase